MTFSPHSFPIVFWSGVRATFLPDGVELPPGKIAAALVFAMQAESFVLADITGRGWCIPGGRLEPGETAEQAARRETWEEIGATLGPLYLLGHFALLDIAALPTDVLPDGSQSAPSASESVPLAPPFADAISPDSILNAQRSTLNAQQPMPNIPSPVRLVPTYLADVTTRTESPPASESRGVQCVRFADIPGCYYAWDALLEAMFAYAWETWQKGKGNP